MFPDVRVCVAFSGGVDSTALLAALARIGGSRCKLRALHVHHGLHQEADACSAHCRKAAHRLGVPLRVLKVQVARSRGASLEAQARDARYAALAGALRPREILATAHHADDQLETVFLQLLRGAGVAGLAAMPEWARFGPGFLVRPLLRRSHVELEGWVRRAGLAWVDDPMNLEEHLDRNFLRAQVLPRVRSRWPSAAASVARSARHAAQAQRILQALGREDAKRAADGAALSVQALRLLDPARRANALRVWIADGGWPLPDARRLEELAGPVLDARADANPMLSWGGVRAQRHADRFAIERLAAPAAADTEVSWVWRPRARQRLPGVRGELALDPDARGPIDLDRLPKELVVRSRRGGERLRPRSGGPTRSLKSLLQESQVPVGERARLPLVFAGERLVAVGDLWSDASVHAGADSARRARIRWRRN